MAKKKLDIIQRFVREIERNTGKLKKDLQRFSKNAHLPHNLEELAGDLRRGAASVSSEIEHYLHDLRHRAARPKAASTPQRRTAKKVGSKRPGATKRKTRKTAKKAATTTAKKRARGSAKKSSRKKVGKRKAAS